MPVESLEIVHESRAEPEAVFGRLADIPRWHEWAGPMVVRSIRDRDGSPDPNGVGALRKVGAPGMWAVEEIVEFIPPVRLTYVLNRGLPVRRYRSTVELEPGPSGGTVIRWRAQFEPLIPGTGPLLKRGLTMTVRQLAKGLAATPPG